MREGQIDFNKGSPYLLIALQNCRMCVFHGIPLCMPHGLQINIKNISTKVEIEKTDKKPIYRRRYVAKRIKLVSK